MKSDSLSSGAGLCQECSFAKIVVSSKEHRFYYCLLSETNSSFPKYPRLPILRCPGFEPQTASPAST